MLLTFRKKIYQKNILNKRFLKDSIGIYSDFYFVDIYIIKVVFFVFF